MNPLRISANLCALCALCVKSSQPAIKSGHSSAKSAGNRKGFFFSAFLRVPLRIRVKLGLVLAAAWPRCVSAV